MENTTKRPPRRSSIITLSNSSAPRNQQAQRGVIGITPLDVVLILGLRVTGQTVNIVRKRESPFLELEGEYGATLWNRKITLASINERLENLGDKDDDEFVRLFLLFTFGTLLFPNTSEKVDSRYLYFLQDIDSVGKFAWGAAVLEDLSDWLSKRKEENVQYVGGCLILLQIWLYEHVDVARPSLRNHDIRFPRACRWDNCKSRHRDCSSLQFKNLQTNQISWYLDLTSEELDLEMVKELLPSPEKTSTSMGNKLSPKYGAYCSQDNQTPNVSVTKIALSNNEGDGALANKKRNLDLLSISHVSRNQGDDVLENLSPFQQVSQKGRSDQSKASFNFELALMADQHYSPPATSCPQEKQNPKFIAMSNDVCNNQGNGVLHNEKLIPNFVSMKNDVCNNQGDGALVNNGCSNQLRSIHDLASTSSGDQCFPSTSCCAQVSQRLNFIDVSSDDNEDESASEDCGMKREISKLRKENTNLRKEVDSLKHQNLLHLSAFVTRLNSIFFSKIADEVLGTNL